MHFSGCGSHAVYIYYKKQNIKNAVRYALCCGYFFRSEKCKVLLKYTCDSLCRQIRCGFSSNAVHLADSWSANNMCAPFGDNAVRFTVRCKTMQFTWPISGFAKNEFR